MEGGLEGDSPPISINREEPVSSSGNFTNTWGEKRTWKAQPLSLLRKGQGGFIANPLLKNEFNAPLPGIQDAPQHNSSDGYDISGCYSILITGGVKSSRRREGVNRQPPHPHARRVITVQ